MSTGTSSSTAVGGAGVASGAAASITAATATATATATLTVWRLVSNIPAHTLAAYASPGGRAALARVYTDRKAACDAGLSVGTQHRLFFVPCLKEDEPAALAAVAHLAPAEAGCHDLEFFATVSTGDGEDAPRYVIATVATDVAARLEFAVGARVVPATSVPSTAARTARIKHTRRIDSSWRSMDGAGAAPPVRPATSGPVFRRAAAAAAEEEESDEGAEQEAPNMGALVRREPMVAAASAASAAAAEEESDGGDRASVEVVAAGVAVVAPHTDMHSQPQAPAQVLPVDAGAAHAVVAPAGQSVSGHKRRTREEEATVDDGGEEEEEAAAKDDGEGEFAAPAPKRARTAVETAE